VFIPVVVLAVINEVPDFFSNARWFHVLNRLTISGLHLVGLLPRPRLFRIWTLARIPSEKA